MMDFNEPMRVETVQPAGPRPGWGQRKDCLIFNFVATNTIEGRVLQRLHEKLQEILQELGKTYHGHRG